MGAVRPEHSADDAGPEAVKGADETTDQTIGGGTPSQKDDSEAARKRERAENSVPGEYPADDPDESGEDRFDAG